MPESLQEISASIKDDSSTNNKIIRYLIQNDLKKPHKFWGGVVGRVSFVSTAEKLTDSITAIINAIVNITADGKTITA